MSSWKQTVAAAIVKQDRHVETLTIANSQHELHCELAALIDAAKVSPGSVGFAVSVLDSYTKYGSWTPKQVDAVRNLIARSTGQAEPRPVEGPDGPLAARLEAALPGIAARDTGFAG
mgnify:CR=1 FL=1